MNKFFTKKAGGPSGSRGRYSSKKRLQVVLRLLLSSESLDTLSRELQVNADTLSAWQDSALSTSFVRAPEGNGVAERRIRNLKEQLSWIEIFETVEDIRVAMQQWHKRYNAQWLVQRHGHRTAEQVRQALVDLMAVEGRGLSIFCVLRVKYQSMEILTSAKPLTFLLYWEWLKELEQASLCAYPLGGLTLARRDFLKKKNGDLL